MKRVARIQIRGLSGEVQRVQVDGRTIDFWSPKNPTHLLIAHDGNNVFDKKSSTLGVTWKMAQKSSKVFERAGLTSPAIIGIYHQGDGPMSHGRLRELAPQQPFQNGVKVLIDAGVESKDLVGDEYHQHIAETIFPEIAAEIGLEYSPTRTAMIGSSMGGLATLYGLGLRPQLFHTALSFSTHWPIGGIPLVDALIDRFPTPEEHKIWMSRGSRKLDSGYGPFQDHANKRMEELGWGAKFKYRFYKGAGHNERAWAKQIEEAFEFWLGM